jgi:hypothetical protein
MDPQKHLPVSIPIAHGFDSLRELVAVSSLTKADEVSEKSKPSPFEEGQLAPLQQEPKSSNPYPDGSQEHAVWLAGGDSTG